MCFHDVMFLGKLERIQTKYSFRTLCDNQSPFCAANARGRWNKKKKGALLPASQPIQIDIITFRRKSVGIGVTARVKLYAVESGRCIKAWRGVSERTMALASFFPHRFRRNLRIRNRNGIIGRPISSRISFPVEHMFVQHSRDFYRDSDCQA